MPEHSDVQNQSFPKDSSKSAKFGQSQSFDSSQSNGEVSPAVLRRVIANPRTATPDAIIALQRTYGNQAVLRLLNKTSAPAQIQRIEGDKGLLELAPGVKGEVGTNGSVDKNALLYPPEKLTVPDTANIHKFNAKTNCVLHDIPGTNWLWVQVPAAQQTEPTSKIDKDSKKKGGDVAALQGLVAKRQANRGSLRHKEIKEPVFPKDPTPEDVQQGGLGDCYFLAALAGVARDNPARIKTMLNDLDDGTVSVRFFQPKAPGPDQLKSFTPQYVVIRKSLLVKTGIFSDTRQFASNAIWPALIEKAYAAWGGHNHNALTSGFKGAYEGVAGGHMNDAWEHLTGMEGIKNEIRSETNEPTMLKQEHVEEFEQGSLFIYPWDHKLTQAATTHTIKPGDTLTSIAAQYGAKAPDLLKGLQDRYEKVKTQAQAMYDKSQALKITDDLKTLGFSQIQVPNGWLATALPTLSPEGRKIWSDYATKNMAAIQKAHKESQRITDDKDASDKFSGVTEISFVKELVKKAGLKAADQTVILDYCKRFMEVAPEKGQIQKYSEPSLQIFNQIQKGLKSGKYVGLGSKDWGKGTGRSGGENTDKVAGIAGGHAYEVVDTIPSTKNEKDQIPPKPGEPKFVIIRNPWGRFGRDYDKDLKPFEIESGQFKLEISDLRRYFNNVYYARINEDSVNQKMAKLNM